VLHTWKSNILADLIGILEDGSGIEEGSGQVEKESSLNIVMNGMELTTSENDPTVLVVEPKDTDSWLSLILDNYLENPDASSVDLVLVGAANETVAGMVRIKTFGEPKKIIENTRKYFQLDSVGDERKITINLPDGMTVKRRG